MSVITDAIRLLDDEVSTFAFLPSINYFYIFLRTSDPSRELTALSILAVFISATSYNILANVDFSSYTGREDDSSESRDTLSGLDLVLPVLFGLVWLVLLGISLVKLYNFFGGTTIWPELLVTVFLLLASLVVSDIFLDNSLSNYNER